MTSSTGGRDPAVPSVTPRHLTQRLTHAVVHVIRLETPCWPTEEANFQDGNAVQSRGKKQWFSSQKK